MMEIKNSTQKTLEKMEIHYNFKKKKWKSVKIRKSGTSALFSFTDWSKWPPLSIVF